MSPASIGCLHDTPAEAGLDGNGTLHNGKYNSLPLISSLFTTATSRDPASAPGCEAGHVARLKDAQQPTVNKGISAIISLISCIATQKYSLLPHHSIVCLTFLLADALWTLLSRLLAEASPK